MSVATARGAAQAQGWIDYGGGSGTLAARPPSWVVRHQKAILVTLVALAAVVCIVAGKFAHQQPNASASHGWVLRGVGLSLGGLEIVVLIALYFRDKKREHYIDLPPNYYRVASLDISPGCQGVQGVIRTLIDIRTSIFCIQGMPNLGDAHNRLPLPPHYLGIGYNSSLIAWDSRLFSLEGAYMGPNEKVDTGQDATKVFLSDPVANTAFSVVNLRVSHRVKSEVEYGSLRYGEANQNRMDKPNFFMINQPAEYEEAPLERIVLPKCIRGSWRPSNPNLKFPVRGEGFIAFIYDFRTDKAPH